ncbi:MAG: hypothetical protein PHD67_08325, partial [Oscillospiraceae bacterium]|nr:hypothetical protein [Oscillospiraceae bacterium]
GKKIMLKNVIASVAQIVLAVLLLPGLCFLYHLIVPDDNGNILLNLFAQVPVLENWLEVLSGALLSTGAPIDVATYAEMVIDPVGQAIADSAVLGMCIYACKTIGTMIYIRGIPVLQTVVGVIVGCITCKAMDGDFGYTLMAVLFLMLLNVVLTILCAHGQVLIKIAGIAMGLGYQMLVAGAGASYAAALALVMHGAVDSLAMAVALLLVPLCALLILLLVDYLFLTPKKLL